MSRVGRDGSEESINLKKNLYRKIIVRKTGLQIPVGKYLLSDSRNRAPAYSRGTVTRYKAYLS